MGTVTDRTGAPLAFAMVTTTSVDTGHMLPAATGLDGTYRFNLPPGNYRLSFEYPGYKVVGNLCRNDQRAMEGRPELYA